MQRLSQQLKQLQKLSPQQIQLMKLLQVPTAMLDERIKEEIEENPALELDTEELEEKPLDEKTNEELKDEFSSDENEDYIEGEEDEGEQGLQDPEDGVHGSPSRGVAVESAAGGACGWGEGGTWNAGASRWAGDAGLRAPD